MLRHWLAIFITICRYETYIPRHFRQALVIFPVCALGRLSHRDTELDAKYLGEGVGDRADGPHQANLFDMDAKYCDVESEQDVLEYLGALVDDGGLAAVADNDFRQWWQDRLPTAVRS